MDIEEYIQQIIRAAKKGRNYLDWNKNEIMRFVYVSLGKELSKSTDFFYSNEGKYGEDGLTVEEMNRIHEADESYEVTCQVTAKMLHRIFDELGIESQLIRAENAKIYEHDGKTMPVYHTYLLCTGEDDKKYFLSLNNDLVNIKMNFRTECFGADVEYYFNGKKNYVGDEIHHSVFSEKELAKIDKHIGYTFRLGDEVDKNGKPVYVYATDNSKFDLYGKQRSNSEDYLDYSLRDLDQEFLAKFYDYCELIEKDNFSEFSVNELNGLKWFIFYSSYNLIMKKLGIDTATTTDEVLNKKIVPELLSGNVDIDKFVGVVKDVIRQNLQGVDVRSLKTRDNPYAILTLMKNFIDSIDKLREISQNELMTYVEKRRRREIYESRRNDLSKMFIPEEVLNMYVGDKNPTNEFIFKKFRTLFERDFECETSETCDYLPPVINDKMGLVEQTNFLKRYLFTVFKSEFPTEKELYDRILFSSMTKKGDKSNHAFVFHFSNPKDQNDSTNYTLIYDPQKNTLDVTDYPKIRLNYDVYSKTFMSRMNGQEDDPEGLGK